MDRTNIYSDSFISKELNISKEMANTLVEDLIRMGYLVEDIQSPTSGISCKSCPYAKSCNSTPIKTFQISSKGKKLLKSM